MMGWPGSEEWWSKLGPGWAGDSHLQYHVIPCSLSALSAPLETVELYPHSPDSGCAFGPWSAWAEWWKDGQSKTLLELHQWCCQFKVTHSPVSPLKELPVVWWAFYHPAGLDRDLRFGSWLWLIWNSPIL